MKKTQVCIIHGGMTFKTRKGYLEYLKTREVSLERSEYWTGSYLDTALGKNFVVVRPRMPLSENAQYEDWKIHFERLIPHLHDNLILIGNSLGGIFLAKYLSLHTFPKKIRAVYLVCPPFDGVGVPEDLVGGFTLPKNLSRLHESTKHLYLMFSSDDPVVPIAHADKYEKKLPEAKVIRYKRKGGHFRISRFPEIVRMMKADVAKK